MSPLEYFKAYVKGIRRSPATPSPESQFSSALIRPRRNRFGALKQLLTGMSGFGSAAAEYTQDARVVHANGSRCGWQWRGSFYVQAQEPEEKGE